MYKCIALTVLEQFADSAWYSDNCMSESNFLTLFDMPCISGEKLQQLVFCIRASRREPINVAVAAAAAAAQSTA